MVTVALLDPPLRRAGVFRPHTVELALATNQVLLSGREGIAVVTFRRDQVAELKSLSDRVQGATATIFRRRSGTWRLELSCSRTKSRWHLLFNQGNAFLLEDLGIFFVSLIEKFST